MSEVMLFILLGFIIVGFFIFVSKQDSATKKMLCQIKLMQY
jgi:hypothetical protein